MFIFLKCTFKNTVIIQPPVIRFFLLIYVCIYLPIYLVIPFIFIFNSLSGPIFINLMDYTFIISDSLVLNGGMISK